MDYGNILSRSWTIVWNNKFMFLLGFLAALGGGNYSSPNAQFNFGQEEFDVSPAVLENIRLFWTQYGVWILALLTLLAILAIILWLVRLLGQASLIEAAAVADKHGHSSLSEAVGAGAGRLLPMVGLNVLLYGPFTLLGLIGGGAVLFSSLRLLSGPEGMTGANLEAFFASLGIVGACIGLLFCILTPVLLVVTVIYPFAQRGVVLQGLGPVAAVRHGWRIVKENFVSVLVLIILFIVIGVVFGFVVGLIMLPLAFLALGPVVWGLLVEGTFLMPALIISAAGIVCLGIVGTIFNALLVTYRSTAFTLAYREFTKA